MTTDLLKAVAEVIRAVAWPSVAVFAGIFFRKDIRELAKRLRKGGPAEFDPPAQSQATIADAATTSKAITKSAGGALSKLPGGVTTTNVEQLIRESEPLKTTTDPVEREQVLVRIAARAVVVGLFEVAEANIYGSQIALLAFLNINRGGVALSDLKAQFYDRAAAQYPAMYENYAFEPYMAFLQRQSFLIVENLLVRISPQGIDYLAWRMEQGKPPKLFG